MADHPPSRRAKLALFLRTRSGLFWAITILAASIAVIAAGSQVAHDRGQSAEWYSGFGSWLGALGSFGAAGAALWISMSDRRHSVADRQRTEDRQDTDLKRQAGLVRVTAEKLGRSQAVGPNIETASIGIRNRRPDRIFDIKVEKFVHHAQEVDLVPALVNGFTVFRRRQEHFYLAAQLPGIALETDEWLIIYQQDDLPNTSADYASVTYTDSLGRRWAVDTDGAVDRL
jgi:hypothetical protein